VERVCERCAAPDDDLVAVHRVEDDADSEGVELWCFTCRSEYPHEPADEAEAED
jgi:hypothetical protein